MWKNTRFQLRGLTFYKIVLYYNHTEDPLIPESYWHLWRILQCY